jgi:cell division septation protein DedD
MSDGTTACRFAEIGLAAPNDDVELKNQLEFQRQRCTALLAQRTDSTKPAEPERDTTRARPPAPPPPPPTPAPAPAPPSAPAVSKGFRVQIVAAPTQAAADQAAESLRQAGYQPVVVKEGSFFKVRSEAFATRAEAQGALVRIKSRLGGQPFIVTDR